MIIILLERQHVTDAAHGGVFGRY